MIVTAKMLVLMYLILMLDTTTTTASPVQDLDHRSKRADYPGYPIGYGNCSFGCCPTGTRCGNTYYPCSTSSTGCCGPVTCGFGYRACAGGNHNCCPVPTCPSGRSPCSGAFNNNNPGRYNFINYFCCPSGYSCCDFTYSPIGNGGGCCRGSSTSSTCGDVGYPCCYGGPTSYSSVGCCGATTTGYCNAGCCNTAGNCVSSASCPGKK